MPDATWEQTTTRLSAILGSLEDGEWVAVGEAPDGTTVRGGLFRRAKPAPVRRVQVVRYEEYLQGQCVGATRHGGDWPVDDDQEAALRALGWRTPEELPTASRSGADYRIDVLLEDEARLATMTTRALELLAVAPDEVRIEGDHS